MRIVSILFYLLFFNHAISQVEIYRQQIKPNSPYYQSLDSNNDLSSVNRESRLENPNRKTLVQLKNQNQRVLKEKIIEKYVDKKISSKWDELDKELFYRKLKFNNYKKIQQDYSFLNLEKIKQIKNEIYF